MKSTLFLLLIISANRLTAQTDSLPSGVYNLNKLSTPQQPQKKSIDGPTTDLASLKIHASTLQPGKTNHTPHALADYEELIFVKEGQLKVNINDSSKTLSPGSFVLIEAGDVQNFQNVSDKPVTYVVLSFKAKAPVNMARGKQAGGSVMKDWNELVARKTERGESRPGINKPTTMFARLDVHATTLNPGFESHPPHVHRAEEIMLLMKGNPTLKVGDNLKDASEGDIMLLRPNDLHNVKNTGTEQCWYYAIQWHALND